MSRSIRVLGFRRARADLSQRQPGQPLVWEVVFTASAYARLYQHLFPGDGDEHGAVVLGGIAKSSGRLRLLVRDVVVAADGTDYVPGERGYRALTPTFIAGVIGRARDERLAYLAVHCHGGRDTVAFSHTDMASHERGYPAMVELTGLPVGALVFARQAVAGDLFLPSGGRLSMSRALVVGQNVTTILPSAPELRPGLGRREKALFDRQARVFGDRGQLRLRELRIGVVGAGGAGMLAVHMLARLGVGGLVVVDPDRIDVSNLPRLPGVPSRDARPWTNSNRIPGPIRRWGQSHRRLKVDRASSIIREASVTTNAVAVAESVDDARAVRELSECDALLLAADTQIARHTANAIAHAYLLPLVQVGVKVPVDRESGDIGEIFAVSRRVNPDSGCLWCNGLIDATELQLEAIGEEGVRAGAYVDDAEVVSPSVISLNGLAVSQAVTDLLFAFTELYDADHVADDAVPYVRYLPRSQSLIQDVPRKSAECIHCAPTGISLLARGDAADLPIAYRRP